jgi:hypothetical protein
MEPVTFVILAVVAFTVAALYSNLGLGGGIMYVPALIMLGGLGKDSAVAASLCLVFAGSLAALYQHRKAGNVDMRLAGLLSIGACSGAVLGTMFNLSISEETFMWLFLSVIVGLSVWMTYDLYRGLRPDRDDDSRMCTPYLLTSMGVAVFGGFLSGAFGIGGGAIMVPILIYLLCRHIKLAVGTSAATIVPTTAVGIAIYLTGGSGNMDLEMAEQLLILAPTCFVGAFLGTKAGIAKLTGKHIKLTFLVLTVLVAVVMAAERLI